MSAFRSTPFTLAQLHTRLIKERPKLKNTPIHTFISDENRPSITLMPLLSAETDSESGEVNNALNPSESSRNKSQSTSMQEGSTPMTKLTGHSTSSISQEPRVLLAVSLSETPEPSDIESWVKWLKSEAPLLIQRIEVTIEAAFRSNSTLVLVSVPLDVWNLLPENSAYRFVDYIKSSNLLMPNNLASVSASNNAYQKEVALPQHESGLLGFQNRNLARSVSESSDSWHSIGTFFWL